MQTIGICRFSYPAIGGFQVTHADTAAREAYLYDPRRMEERFALFETLTLPPLRAQTSKNFTLAVVVGESLPRSYRDRLDALLADLPQAVVLALPSLPHRKAMQTTINDLRTAAADEYCLQFRMDDDDAVACDFVERLRQSGRDLQRMAQRHGTVALDYCRGFIVRAGPSGLMAAPTDAALSAAGLGVLIKPKLKTTIMNYGHQNIGNVMPVVRFTNPHMMVRSHNSHNDSRQKPTARRVSLLPVDPDAEQMFRDRFNIDADHVRAVFSRLE